MDLSIIITHHNTPELLDLCLKSINKTVKNVKYETIVADSESKEKVEELIREEYLHTKLISFKDNVGYSRIVNAALKKAKGNYILILNADIIILDGSVSKMLIYMKNHLRVGVIGPQLLDFTGNVQRSCFSRPSLRILAARRTFLGKTKWGKRQINKFLMEEIIAKSRQPVPVDWLQGSAVMIRKQAIKKVGLWDERFFMYFEDADLCRRFWKNGYEVVYFPEAKMVHYYHRSSKKWGGFLDLFLNKYTRIHLISALKYFWKYRKLQ